MGFEPTRRLDTAYAISNLKRAPYLFRARRLDLSHCVRLVWPLAAFGKVLIYSGVHCVRSRTGPVAVNPFEQNLHLTPPFHTHAESQLSTSYLLLRWVPYWTLRLVSVAIIAITPLRVPPTPATKYLFMSSPLPE